MGGICSSGELGVGKHWATVRRIRRPPARGTTFARRRLCSHLRIREDGNLQRKEKDSNMTIQKMTRSFRYSGLILPEPASELDIESVRSFYAASYPEITTATLTGPEAVDGTLVYTFTKAIGTKG